MAYVSFPSADRAPTGRAKCVQCSQSIAKGALRVIVAREVETDAFSGVKPGYLHFENCARAYCDAAGEKPWADFVKAIKKHSALPAEELAFDMTASAAEREKAARTLPAFEGVTEKALRTLADKLAVMKETYDASALFDRAKVEYRARGAALAHLAANGFYDPVKSDVLLSVFSELAPSMDHAKHAAMVSALLPRLPNDCQKLVRRKGWSVTVAYLPGWSWSEEGTLAPFYFAAPEAFTHAPGALQPNVQRALDALRVRNGEAVSVEAKRAVLEGMAERAALEPYLSNMNVTVRRTGKLVEERLGSPASVRSIATLFGTDTEWNAAVLDQVRKHSWLNLASVADALATATLGECFELLVAWAQRNGSRQGDQWHTTLGEMLDRRGDSPAEWLSRARSLADSWDKQSGTRGTVLLAEALGLYAIERSLRAGLALPEGSASVFAHVESLPASDDSSASELRVRYLAAVAALPRDEVRAVVSKALENEYFKGEVLGLLAPHFDEALYRRALEAFAAKSYVSITGSELGAPGLPAVPMLAELHAATTDAEKRHALHVGILWALASASRKRTPFDPAWDRFATFGDYGRKESSYWPEGPRLEAIYRAMPAERAVPLLTEAAEKGPFPGRAIATALAARHDAGLTERLVLALLRRRSEIASDALDASIRALGPEGVDAMVRHADETKGDADLFSRFDSLLAPNDVARIKSALSTKAETKLEAIARLAGEIAGDTTLVYVMDLDPQPRTSDTLSRVGGEAPGLTEDEYPKGGDGEPKAHILTIDFADVPLLGRMYPQAGALALFVENPEHSKHLETASLVEIPRAKLDARPARGTGEEVLTLFPVKVPIALFESELPPPLQALRTLIFNRLGYVFGEPMWIQHPEDGGDFLFQVSERAGLNLGDSGELYVFKHGTTWQCY